MRIAVLFGGTSEERDVSIASAAQIIPALRALGHEVHAVDTATGRLPPAAEHRLLTSGVAPAPPSTQAMDALRSRSIALSPSSFDVRDVDVVFLACTAAPARTAACRRCSISRGSRYTGSNHIASAAAMDKDLSKRLFRVAGVPTADWLHGPGERRRGGATLGWPVS